MSGLEVGLCALFRDEKQLQNGGEPNERTNQGEEDDDRLRGGVNLL